VFEGETPTISPYIPKPKGWGFTAIFDNKPIFPICV
jgi:hypothetical protein